MVFIHALFGGTGGLGASGLGFFGAAESIYTNAVKIKKKTAIDSTMKIIKTTIRIESNLHSKYKKFCKENGLVFAKRIEDFMRADLEKRLIKIPKVEL